MTCFCSSPEQAIKAPGVVEAEIVSIKALVPGVLEEWSAVEGMSVKKDEVIGGINQDKLINQFEELEISEKEIEIMEERATNKIPVLKAQVSYLNEQVESFERLNQDRAVSGEKLEQARLQLLEVETSLFDLQKSLEAYKIQRKKVRNKRNSLELMRQDFILKSPVDGIVLETHATQGEALFPSMIVADILDVSSLHVEVFVEEQEMSVLELNDSVVILVDGLDDREFKGTISYFGEKAEFSPKYILSEKERKALLYQVNVRIEEGREVFKVGMPVTVIFGE
jgi:HlyD family secretion protein